MSIYFLMNMDTWDFKTKKKKNNGWKKRKNPKSKPVGFPFLLGYTKEVIFMLNFF